MNAYTIPTLEKDALVSELGLNPFYLDGSDWKITDEAITYYNSQSIDINAACNTLYSQTILQRYGSSLEEVSLNEEVEYGDYYRGRIYVRKGR